MLNKLPREPTHRKRPLDPRVGQLVRAARNRCGLSLRQLADQIGLAHSTIEAYEIGASRIPLEQLDRIASALHVNLSAFLPDETNELIDAVNRISEGVSLIASTLVRIKDTLSAPAPSNGDRRDD